MTGPLAQAPIRSRRPSGRVHKPAPDEPTDHAKDSRRRRSRIGSDPPSTGAHILTVKNQPGPHNYYIPCVAEFASNGSSAPPAAARTCCIHRPTRLPAGRSRTLRAAFGRARAGRRGGCGGEGNDGRRRRRRSSDTSSNRAVSASPSTVHEIVHVAPPMSRPLRAARGGLRPAWTSPPRRDQRPGRGADQVKGASLG